MARCWSSVVSRALNCNCHFVSRFLTRPWEWGDRQLFYYDLDARALRTKSSRTLFAAEGHNTAEVEARLNELIETPLSRALPDFIADLHNPNPVTTDTWERYRALVLLMPIQALRVTFPTGDDSFEDLLSLPLADLDDIARLADRDYCVYVVGCAARYRLFYPETGLFWFPVRGTGSAGVSFASGIPITEQFAIVHVPRHADIDAAIQKARRGAYLANMSIGGGSHVRRVVVHRDIVDHYPEAVIGREIEESHARTTALLTKSDEINAMIDAAYKSAGLEAPKRS
jgi:hypothetical protein